MNSTYKVEKIRENVHPIDLDKSVAWVVDHPPFANKSWIVPANLPVVSAVDKFANPDMTLLGCGDFKIKIDGVVSDIIVTKTPNYVPCVTLDANTSFSLPISQREKLIVRSESCFGHHFVAVGEKKEKHYYALNIVEKMDGFRVVIVETNKGNLMVCYDHLEWTKEPFGVYEDCVYDDVRYLYCLNKPDRQGNGDSRVAPRMVYSPWEFNYFFSNQVLGAEGVIINCVDHHGLPYAIKVKHTNTLDVRCADVCGELKLLVKGTHCVQLPVIRLKKTQYVVLRDVDSSQIEGIWEYDMDFIINCVRNPNRKKDFKFCRFRPDKSEPDSFAKLLKLETPVSELRMDNSAGVGKVADDMSVVVQANGASIQFNIVNGKTTKQYSVPIERKIMMIVRNSVLYEHFEKIFSSKELWSEKNDVNLGQLGLFNNNSLDEAMLMTPRSVAPFSIGSLYTMDGVFHSFTGRAVDGLYIKDRVPYICYSGLTVSELHRLLAVLETTKMNNCFEYAEVFEEKNVLKIPVSTQRMTLINKNTGLHMPDKNAHFIHSVKQNRMLKRRRYVEYYFDHCDYVLLTEMNTFAVACLPCGAFYASHQEEYRNLLIACAWYFTDILVDNDECVEMSIGRTKRVKIKLHLKGDLCKVSMSACGYGCVFSLEQGATSHDYEQMIITVMSRDRT